VAGAFHVGGLVGSSLDPLDVSGLVLRVYDQAGEADPDLLCVYPPGRPTASRKHHGNSGGAPLRLQQAGASGERDRDPGSGTVARGSRSVPQPVHGRPSGSTHGSPA
jgi:hypothetical protein